MDPFADAMSILSGGMPQQGMPRSQSGPALPPLTPQEEDSLLSRVGSGALSGLGYVGSSLGKAFGGRAIRGALGGNARELLSIIPFSDAMGITNPEEEVHGSQLLGSTPDTPFLSAQGLGGLGLDILLDPATYLSFGASALTKTGQAAKAAGVLPKTVAGRLAGLGAGDAGIDALARVAGGADNLIGSTAAVTPEMIANVAGQRLGGHVGVGLPFMGNAATFDLGVPGAAVRDFFGGLPGAGAVSSAVSPAIGWAGDKLGGLKRGAQALFQADKMGQTDPVLQAMAGHVSENLPGRMAAANQAIDPLLEQAARVAGWQPGMEMTPAIEAALHGQIPGLRQALEGTGPIPAGLEDVVTGAARLNQQGLEAARAVGYADNPLESTLDYATRQATIMPKDKAFSATKGGAVPTDQLARQDVFKNIPTGAPGVKGTINDLSTRKDLLGLPDLDIAQAIRRDVLGMSQADEVAFNVMQQNKGQTDDLLAEMKLIDKRGGLSPVDKQKLAQMTVDEAKRVDLEAKWVQSAKLTDWYKGLDHDALGQTGGYFGNHGLKDLGTKMRADAMRVLKAEAFHKGIAKSVMSEAEAGAGAYSINRLLDEAGLKLPIKDHATETGALYATLKALQQEGKLAKGAKTDDLGKLFIPKDTAEAMINFTNASTSPKGLDPFLGVYDSLTNLTKAGQTVLWPANHMRNQTTAFFQNWVHGAFDPSVKGPMGYIKPWLDAKKIHGGGVAEGLSAAPAFKGLDDAAASQELMRQAHNYGLFGKHTKQASEVVGNQAWEVPGRVFEIPGAAREGFGAQLGKLATKDPGAWNPLNTAGVGQATVDKFAPIAAGRGVGGYLDDVNRLSVAAAKLKQGYSMEAAMEAAFAAHYDFGNLSKFEKGVMRRAIPFYNWSRQNIPAVIGEIAGKPGGKVATTIKATTAAKGEDPGFIPEWLGQGVALPIGGQGEDGTQRFLSSFGLPIEDMGNLMGTGSVLGQLNPLLKAPLEVMTGRQFHTGRNLGDLHPTTGNTIADQALFNSPISRFATTGRQMADPRKSWGDVAFNLLSGARITDIDMNRQRGIAARDYAEDLLRGQPGVSQYQRMFVSPENLPLLSQEEQNLYRLLQTQARRAQSQGRQAQPSR